MVIFVKPNGATVVENDVIGLGSFVGKIAVVSPTRTGAYVTLHVAPANGEYLKPMYCAPMISTDVDDLGIYLCDMTRRISAVSGRVRYQVSFVYENGREEFTPEGSFTVSQGVVSIPPDDPSESMYNAIRSALIANINNYTEIVEKLDMVWGAKKLVEENLEKINASRDAAAASASKAEEIKDQTRDVVERSLSDAKESGMFDGVSVTHEWDGSVLRVTSASGTSESDLRGPEGKRGETGKGFEISKTYESVSEMHAGFATDDVPLYGFVLIDTGNVEDEDNAKLYVKHESGYVFLTDLSGSEGIKGERGYSAFELAVKQGFVGGEAEWLASLKKPAEDAAKEVRAAEDERNAAEAEREAAEAEREAAEAEREAAEQQRKAISEDVYNRANAAITLASQSASRAAESESAAKISETNANGYKNAAEAAQAAAEKARDEVESAVGGDFVDNQIGIHNVNAGAHNDIRQLIEGLAGRLNALANSDDTTLDQMAEVVAYIKSNRDLIAQITTNKVNVTDIVNDLVTNVSNKPLSAAQGVALKALIDAIKIPTTLPASDVYNWAKQPNKPSYSASEVGARPNTWTPTAADVGALPTSGGTVSGNIFLGTGAIPSSNFGAVLGTDALRFFQLFGGEYYFANVDPNHNSPYKFGMYQWDDNFTFVTRWAEGNSFYKDAWHINGSTAVTNFAERPTVAGAGVALQSEIPTSHSAGTITAGTFGGQVVANANGQGAGTSLLRNSKLVSADENPTVNGEICWTYK